MDVKDQAGDSGVRLSVQKAVTRQRPKDDVASTFSLGAQKVADTALAIGAQAGFVFPARAVVGAAIKDSQVTAGMGGAGVNSVGLTGNGVVSGGAGGAATPGASSNFNALVDSGNPDAVMMAETSRIQELNRSFSLQYLQLQQQMQQENREFTMLSNVMKTRHDTAKAAINNVR